MYRGRHSVGRVRIQIFQVRSVTDIWGRDKLELIHNKSLRRVGDKREGHGQRFVILMVKIKEFLAGGTCPQCPPPAFGPANSPPPYLVLVSELSFYLTHTCS